MSFDDETPDKKVEGKDELDVLMQTTEQDKSAAKIGVLVNYQVDKESNETVAIVNVFKTKNPRQHPVLWVPIKKVKMHADLSLGLVSQQWLETNATHDTDCITKLRTLQMLSYQESLAEKNASLCHIFRQDNEAKTYCGQKGINCKKCNYPSIQPDNPDIRCLKCSRCSGYIHELCLDPYQRKISASESSWRCPDCKRCQHCRSQMNKETLLNCQTTNTPCHYECLRPQFRQSLRPFPYPD